MTIANENNRVDLVASGGQTVFAYNFRIDAADEIAVYLTPTGDVPNDTDDILVLTTDYTLSGLGNDGGGSVTLVSGATSGDAFVALRAIEYDQDEEYVIGQDHAEQLELSIDRMAMRMQRLSEEVNRALRGSVTGGAFLTPEFTEFTPKLYANIIGGSPISLTGAVYKGDYYVLGEMVFFNMSVFGTVPADLPVGSLYIGDLPYLVKDDGVGTRLIVCQCLVLGLTDITAPTKCQAWGGADRVYPTFDNETPLNNTQFDGGNYEIRVSGWYPKA